MLFTLNHIKEIMYYWGDNYKMQTSHTLCSRPKRYGALQEPIPEDGTPDLFEDLQNLPATPTPPTDQSMATSLS